jgi:hypothetical protein
VGGETESLHPGKEAGLLLNTKVHLEVVEDPSAKG